MNDKIVKIIRGLGIITGLLWIFLFFFLVVSPNSEFGNHYFIKLPFHFPIFLFGLVLVIPYKRINSRKKNILVILQALLMTGVFLVTLQSSTNFSFHQKLDIFVAVVGFVSPFVLLLNLVALTLIFKQKKTDV